MITVLCSPFLTACIDSSFIISVYFLGARIIWVGRARGKGQGRDFKYVYFLYLVLWVCRYE